MSTINHAEAFKTSFLAFLGIISGAVVFLAIYIYLASIAWSLGLSLPQAIHEYLCHLAG